MHAQWRGFENASSQRKESGNILQEIKNDWMKGMGWEKGIRESVEHVKKEETDTLTCMGYICIHELSAIPLEAQKLWNSQNNYPLAVWLDNGVCDWQTSTILLLNKSWGLPSLKPFLYWNLWREEIPNIISQSPLLLVKCGYGKQLNQERREPEGKSTQDVFNRRGWDSGAAY